MSIHYSPLKQIEANCDEAGLQIMGQILCVLWNREEVAEANLLKASEDPQDLYDRFVGPAIDQLENYLLGEDA